MSSSKKFILLGLSVILISRFVALPAQDNISWLNDYTGEMLIGTDNYRYSFTNEDGNDCKLKFEEYITNKKGSTKSSSWVFYLADIDPSAVSFKSSGKSLSISIKTKLSRKFISFFENGAFDEYTEEIKMTMNDVEMARSFIESMKENISSCTDTQTDWENREQAYEWLVQNIGEASFGSTTWQQKFGSGPKAYLVEINSKSVDSKGVEKSFLQIFDLNDINPLAIDLKISGKTLAIEIPVREKKKFIDIQSSGVKEYSDKMLVYVNDLETARNTVNALSYLVTNTMPERPDWANYTEALGFVKENLGEVNQGKKVFLNGLEFDNSPAGLVQFKVKETNSGVEGAEDIYVLYLADLMQEISMNVTSSGISLKLNTKDKQSFIKKMVGDKISSFSSSLDLNSDNIDKTRDIIRALEFAISKSELQVKEFKSLAGVKEWTNANVETIDLDEEKYEQKLDILHENEDQVILNQKLTGKDGKTTESSYMVYPDDIDAEQLKVNVSGKKLSVNIATGKNKYIRNFKDGAVQNFTNKTEVLFYDPLTARNFISALQFLKAGNSDEKGSDMSMEEAGEYLKNAIVNIELPGEKFQQKIEFPDNNNCKVIFTRTETDSKGSSTEYRYEFTMSDIHPENSALSVKSELLLIDLVTNGKEKLIKPFKNGTAENFSYEFPVYAEDVLVAKKILAAFGVLSKGCK